MIQTGEWAAERVFFAAATISAFITLVIFGFMFYFGLPLFTDGRFFEVLTRGWAPYHNSFGIFPMIMGSIAVSFAGLAFAFPLSMGCATLIEVYDRNVLARLVRKTVEMMTGMPTVIYGFVGIFLLVPFIRGLFDGGSGMCVLSASLMLALLVSPTMILFFIDSFERVPRSYGDAVLAVGGSPVQKFLYLVLPSAWRGIVIGTILALGRALGDTLIALMIAGNAVRTPGSLLDSARTLTAHIALVFAADYESLEFKAIFACGLILYTFTTILVVLVRWAASQGRKP